MLVHAASWKCSMAFPLERAARYAARSGRPHCAGPSGFLALLAFRGVRANSLRSNMRGPDPRKAALLSGAEGSPSPHRLPGVGGAQRAVSTSNGSIAGQRRQARFGVPLGQEAIGEVSRGHQTCFRATEPPVSIACDPAIQPIAKRGGDQPSGPCEPPRPSEYVEDTQDG